MKICLSTISYWCDRWSGLSLRPALPGLSIVWVLGGSGINKMRLQKCACACGRVLSTPPPHPKDNRAELQQAAACNVAHLSVTRECFDLPQDGHALPAQHFFFLAELQSSSAWVRMAPLVRQQSSTHSRRLHSTTRSVPSKTQSRRTGGYVLSAEKETVPFLGFMHQDVIKHHLVSGSSWIWVNATTGNTNMSHWWCCHSLCNKKLSQNTKCSLQKAVFFALKEACREISLHWGSESFV